MAETRRLPLGLLAVVLASCAPAHPATPRSSASASETSCATLIAECHAERLPDLVLSEGTPAPDGAGALGPVNGSIEGVIGFDQALLRAWSEDGHADAKTVQVVLGSADPGPLHWQTTHHLFYGVVWGGICAVPKGGIRLSPGALPTCITEIGGTVIDALTGAFIVGGESPPSTP